MLVISKDLLDQIYAHVEKAYPEEGAGFLIGNGGKVENIFSLPNAREDEARHNRFLITPEDEKTEPLDGPDGSVQHTCRRGGGVRRPRRQEHRREDDGPDIEHRGRAEGAAAGHHGDRHQCEVDHHHRT